MSRPLTTHRKPNSQLGLLTITLLAMLLLAACSEQIRPLPPVSERPVSADTRRAEALEAQGQPREAALDWLALARQAPADEANYLLLRAADAWLVAGERSEAEQTLAAIGDDLQTLDPRSDAWLNLVLARLALMDGDPTRAMELLDDLPSRLPNRLGTRVQQVEQNLGDAGRYREDRELDSLPEARIETGSVDQIVRQVRRLDSISMQRLGREVRSSDPDTAAWVALALALRDNLFASEDAMVAALDRWQQRYRIDTLGRGNLQELARRFRGSFQPPLSVALLLPLTGNLAAAGELVQHGFLSAALEDPRPGTVQVLDTGSTEAGARSALFSAREQRMSQIVGPIGQAQVQALTEIPGQTIPILALNQPQDVTRISLDVLGQFASLGLIPEDEARAVARYASEYGFDKALVIAETGSQGQRLTRAFSDAFDQLGGQVAYALDLPSSTRDYAGLLQGAISRTRPDVIFLATGASAARVIKPQLKFIDADEIQVMATSQIYNGPTNSRSDRDLDGAWLTWTPWLMDLTNDAVASSDVRELLDGMDSPMQLSLFALGMDAWGVLPYLELLRENAGMAYPGLTGELRIDRDGHLRRTPALVEIRGGRPQPLNTILPMNGLNDGSAPPDR